MPSPLPPWRQLLRGAREREGRSPLARWLQVATVAADATPRVRTLVFRGWAEPAALDLLTDGRSSKAAELGRQAAVELCWLLPKARSQFRLRGRVVTLPLDVVSSERRRHWLRLTPEARALWAWPPPGAPVNPNPGLPSPQHVSEDAPMPEHFLLLRIALDQVELLELTGHPHRRRRWQAATDWAEEHLNP